ncbi:prolyl-tRNA synthetase [Candidatus Kaiserbacteria bacterium RIFCSPHIGHO2_01_FULL_56_24]|uniref:Proline--tRNA ligase n=1 Tax=Candidatus Kaiserbacteria bacterium RIFCSPHIGHO2_01_FULL_56_24 TaxID=1798487 RepID=A0A1F6DH59_9BACT|nr:MAG: prolyl-tRNA synthetase [Candidatus Kaiserbacteria bacterium RIFCSPHIGHO2_01_FULL_56_24]
MRQSQLFTRTRKDAPKDEVAKNAQLLIRAGYINKEMAGVYDFLPLGLRVLGKIIGIIREEMNAIGGQEVLMSALQRRELWEKTDRWDDKKIDNWFKTSLKDGGLLGLGFTHEEPITNMVEQFIPSYQNLPFTVYQFQTKFRNEERAKSGLMRTREFIMKDLYSFSKNEIEHLAFYEKAKDAYKKIFNRVGIGDRTYLTYASGGSFSQFSHEFQTLSEAGEDTIYVHKDDYGKGLQMKTGRAAINKEIFTDDVKKDLGIEGDFEEKKAVEVGNIFTLGTRFSEALLCRFKDENGEEVNPYMGSYGIGPARLMGVIVETLSDEKGIVWPKEVAPFHVHLVSITGGNADVEKEADRVYEMLQDNDIEVLYDDRDARAGEKFNDADLIGIPMRLVVSEKTVSAGGVELALRNNGKGTLVHESDIIERLQDEK